MRAVDPARTVVVAATAITAVASPPLRSLLESTMSLHMLVQLPILAAAGFVIGKTWLHATPGARSARALTHMQTFNAGGFTGLILAGFVMVLWMVPRLLDMARLEISVDVLKFLSVPLAGVALAMSWRRLPAIAKAVVHLEAIATLLRFGWGYLAAEERLCLSYLANDQRLTGTLLLWLASVYAIIIVWRPMFGRALTLKSKQTSANAH